MARYEYKNYGCNIRQVYTLKVFRDGVEYAVFKGRDLQEMIRDIEKFTSQPKSAKKGKSAKKAASPDS